MTTQYRSRASAFMCGFGRGPERIEKSIHVEFKYPSPEKVLSMPDREEFKRKIKMAAKVAGIK